MAQGDVLGFIKNRPGNFLINGLTEIRQRSAIGLAMDATFAYRVQDRFVTKVNNTGDFNTRIQSNTVLTDTKGVVQEAMNIATNAVNVNAQVFIQQMIESLNAQALANKKASFSFEFLNRGFTDVTVNVYYPTVIDDHTIQTLIDSKSETFAIDTVTKKMKFENISIPVEAKNGLAIEIVIDGITIAADWDNPISKFMFNEGPVVAEFERAGFDIANEVQLCERYYEKSYNLNDAPGTITQDGAMMTIGASNTFFTVGLSFLRKRVVPIVTTYNPVTGGSGTWRNNSAGNNPTATPTRVGENSFSVANASGVSHQIIGHFTVDAEL